MMKIYNIGLVGFGGFGQFLYHHWSEMDNVCISAIADPIAKKSMIDPACTVYKDWREMLEDPDIDVIAIATVPDTHEIIAIESMKAGKHVFIEKPLAISVNAAKRIIEVRDQTNRVASIDFLMRFNPLLQSIKELIDQQVFGEMRRVNVENYAQDEQLPQHHWFWDHNKSGGILIEHGVHFIDLIHFLKPSVVSSVNGLKANRNGVQEDQIMANILYKSGLIATHYHSFNRPGFFETTKVFLSFDLADIELTGWIPLTGKVNVLVNPQTKQILKKSPYFSISKSEFIADLKDESRPEGWGNSPTIDQKTFICSGGVNYEVSECITGVFDINRSKQDVYASCVQSSLDDILQKIDNQDHILLCPLEAGLESLKIAVEATDVARSK